jgi:hypothetical protein
MNFKQYGCNFKLTFMSLSILESGTSSSADGLGVDFYRALTTDSSPNQHCQPCLVVFQFLAHLLFCSLKIIYAPIAEVTVLEGLKIVMNLVDFISCLCRLVCPDTDNSLFSGVIARITRGSSHLISRRNEITC